MDLVMLWGEVIERTHPLIRPLPDLPARPADEELRTLTARAVIFSSEDVVAAIDELARWRSLFLVWADTIDSIQAQHAPNQLPEARQRLEEARTGFREQTTVLHRAIRADLRG
jgi:hypothetical protein